MSLEDFSLTEQLKRLIESDFGPSDKLEYQKKLKDLADHIDLAKPDIRRMSRTFRALSHPTRLRILMLLKAGEMCVCEIMAVLNTTQPTTSHHLNILKNIGLVEERREGKWVFYSLVDSKLSQDMINIIFPSRSS